VSRTKKVVKVTVAVGFIAVLTLACLRTLSWSAEPESGPPEAPVKGMVTMVDIGAKECIPCKMMAPIMEELKNEYKGRAAILFIDVWKYRGEGRKYGVRTIPTQVFYDRDGKEVMRHQGFMDKKSIVAELEKLGVK